ncbi:MAG: hypothetical protein IKN30_05915 [Synergistaceae bacterium]|nr:hypothetical protein [Synergistaceae bacterium]MBR6901580.1 hypothetical protein [Synergistaceae bacterium]
MKKFNRKFNNLCSRCNFWQALEIYFYGFTDLLKPNDSLTSEDKLILHKVHSLLFECSQVVKDRKNLHMSKITDLIGAFNEK